MDLDAVLREFKASLIQLYGERLIQLVLYGSYARGKGTPGSDIDLLVVLGGDVDQGREIDHMLDAVTDLNLKHDVLVSIIPVSSTDFSSLNSPLLLNVRREGVIV